MKEFYVICQDGGDGEYTPFLLENKELAYEVCDKLECFFNSEVTVVSGSIDRPEDDTIRDLLENFFQED